MAETSKHLDRECLPKKDQFQRLSPSRKRLLDTIKMIAYRAETAMANIVKEKLARKEDARAVEGDEETDALAGAGEGVEDPVRSRGQHEQSRDRPQIPRARYPAAETQPCHREPGGQGEDDRVREAAVTEGVTVGNAQLEADHIRIGQNRDRGQREREAGAASCVRRRPRRAI